MQIIIPMSGFGERFKRAGYKTPKPLIIVDGKPMIAHVINLFPGETDMIFVCNKEHMEDVELKLEMTILKYCPTAKIIAIEPHKLGPVHAVLSAVDHIDLNKPTIINYCDFSCYWDWHKFKLTVREKGCSGAIPAYKGFHPHSLGNTNYAYIKEKDTWALDIQEKQPFTKNRLGEYASSGTYYFASGKLLLDSLKYVIDKNLNTKGEFYISLAYKYLFLNKEPVLVYSLEHFMQWGTPEDLAEYSYWSQTFERMQEPKVDSANVSVGTIIIPVAGEGKRFLDEGYSTTKPLIKIGENSMIANAVADLPESQEKMFVIRSDNNNFCNLKKNISDTFPKAHLTVINNPTKGQAETALIGLNNMENSFRDVPTPIIVGACDNGVIFNTNNLDKLVHEGEYDIVVWGVRNYPAAQRKPTDYGWINENEGLIEDVWVKKTPENLMNTPVVIGTFMFKNSRIMKNVIEKTIEDKDKINNEYYLDSCVNTAINMGLICKFFEVYSYICWGTPNELKTFNYWKNCFSKWASHPYKNGFL